MSAEYDRLLSDCAVHAPGALQSAVEAELFATLRDFLTQTNLWRCQYEIEIVAGTRCYTISPGGGVSIKRLMNFFDSEDTMKRWVWPAAMDTPGTIMLGRTPTQAATWVADVSVFAVDGSNGSDCRRLIPGWILSTYFDAVFQGTVGRLQTQPLKPYSNAQLGLGHLRLYHAAKARARADQAQRNVYDAQAWQFPSMGITRGSQRGV
jgi:hypothetical protein